jgi:hypothetical protein
VGRPAKKMLIRVDVTKLGVCERSHRAGSSRADPECPDGERPVPET